MGNMMNEIYTPMVQTDAMTMKAMIEVDMTNLDSTSTVLIEMVSVVVKLISSYLASEK